MNVPLYTTCHTPVVATGKDGRDPGELHLPMGVAIHEENSSNILSELWP